MRTSVESRTGGVAVLIPEAVAARSGLRGGEAAELAGPATLTELLAGITPENLQDEWAPGAPVGTELL